MSVTVTRNIPEPPPPPADFVITIDIMTADLLASMLNNHDVVTAFDHAAKAGNVETTASQIRRALVDEGANQNILWNTFTNRLDESIKTRLELRRA